MDTPTLRNCHFSFEGVEFDFLIDETEEIITQNVLSTGAWEQNQLELYSRYVPENGILVDVGANVGVNSIFAKKRIPSARVHAIEASEQNFEILQKNLDSTGIMGHFLAIADHDGTIRFAGAGTNAQISDEGVEVPCLTLDTFAKDLPVIDLLKVDVEGFTDVVLSGAQQALCKTRRVIIEFSTHDIRKRFGNSVTPERHFNQLLKNIPFPHVYYISREDGLVEIHSASDLVEILSIEYGVGDLLFSHQIEPSISLSGLLIRKIKTLLTHNHNILTELFRLSAKVG